MKAQRTQRLLPLFLASLGSLTLASAAQEGGDWPQWRGPGRDGRVLGKEWPEGLSEEQLVLRWEVTDLGPSYASPIVGPKRVYTVETRNEESEVVQAYDRETGELVWERDWEGSIEVPFFAARNGSWVRSTPTLHQGLLFVGGMRDHLVCLEAETGEFVWEVDFCERFETPVPSFGMVCSPLVTDEHVFVQAGGGLVKLERETGKTVWRSLVEGGGMDSPFSSPILAELEGREQLLVLTRARMVGVEPTSGEELWSQPVESFRGMNILTPIPVGNGVFTAPYGGRAQLLLPKEAEAGYEVTKAWECRSQGYMTSPVLVDDHAYIFLRSNRFACIDLKAGTQNWTSPPTGEEYASMTVQGDRMLALSDSGMLYLLKANPTEYEELGRVQVAEEETWAHLGVIGNELYIRGQTSLLVYDWKQSGEEQ